MGGWPLNGGSSVRYIDVVELARGRNWENIGRVPFCKFMNRAAGAQGTNQNAPFHPGPVQPYNNCVLCMSFCMSPVKIFSDFQLNVMIAFGVF